MDGALAHQPALTFNAPTGFPAGQPTTGSPSVINSPPVTSSPSALGEPRTPVVILAGAQPRRAAAPPRRHAGPDSEEGRRTDGRKALAARRSG